MFGTRYDVDDRVEYQYPHQFPHIGTKERQAQKHIVNVILFIKSKHDRRNQQMVLRTTHDHACWNTCKTGHTILLLFCLSPIF